MPKPIEDLRSLNETTERMIAELTGRPRLGEPSGPQRDPAPKYIGPRHLKPLEEYKPSSKNPKSRSEA